MKTIFYWVALLASAAMIAQANAGGHHGGGGFAPAAPALASQAAPAQSFDGGRMIYSGQRISPAGLRSPSSAASRQYYSNSSAPIVTRQFTRGSINRSDRLTQFANRGNHPITAARREGNGAGQLRSGNNLPTNWRNHVVGQHSANWHRDWDRRRDHWWQGHRCRFVNGSWFIFDTGFYPWWPDWYPYDYYSYYSYSYNPGYYYDTGSYDQNGYADQYADSTVAAVQQQLAELGYYRGEIDGSFGPETRRAIVRYQRIQGLRVTGYLTPDTLQALGRVASN
jgi:hypothetical protein